MAAGLGVRAIKSKNCRLPLPTENHGGLAQLARALALQARGHRFESDILHHIRTMNDEFILHSFFEKVL